MSFYLAYKGAQWGARGSFAMPPNWDVDSRSGWTSIDGALRWCVRRDRRRVLLLSGWFTVALIVIGVLTIVGGEPGIGAWVLFSGLTMLAMIAYGTRLVGRAPAVRTSRGATLVPRMRMPLLSLAAFLLALGGPLVLFGVGAALDDEVGVAVLLFLLSTPFLYPVALMVIGRYPSGGVSLTPEGITHSGWGLSSTIAWADITDVDPPGRTSSRRQMDFLTVDVQARYDPDSRDFAITNRRRAGAMTGAEQHSTRIAVPTKHLALTVWELIVVLRLYREHPHLRAELGTDASIERILAMTSWPIDDTRVSGLEWFRTAPLGV